MSNSGSIGVLKFALPYYQSQFAVDIRITIVRLKSTRVVTLRIVSANGERTGLIVAGSVIRIIIPNGRG